MSISGLRRIGTAALLVGAMLVGAAIALDGDAGRLVNGLGGILWFASTAVLTIAAAKTQPPVRLWAAMAGLTLAVAFVVKPSAALPAMAGFIPAGYLIATVARKDWRLWAVLVPAWYLPAHIGTAVAKSAINSLLGNEAGLRTDPPPTAAIVPLLMVVCALLGGELARRVQGLSQEDQLHQRSLAREE